MKRENERLLDHLSSEDLVHIFRSGSIVKVKDKVLSSKLKEINLEYLQRNFGSVPINTHDGFEAKAPLSTDIAAAKNPTLNDFIQRLHQNKDLDLKTWHDEIEGSTEDSMADRIGNIKEEYDRFQRLYGVLNMRRLKTLYDQLPFELFSPWQKHFSFLWMGYSIGGLHFDPFHGILFQISGKKRVVLFDQKYTDVIDGRHYVERMPNIRFLSPRNLKENPWLQSIPYYEIELNPGEAVSIPAYTYHAPLGGFDSISINAFLCPHPKRKDLIPDTSKFTIKKENSVYSPSKYRLMSFSSLWFNLTGKVLDKARIGPYEFF